MGQRGCCNKQIETAGPRIPSGNVDGMGQQAVISGNGGIHRKRREVAFNGGQTP